LATCKKSKVHSERHAERCIGQCPPETIFKVNSEVMNAGALPGVFFFDLPVCPGMQEELKAESGCWFIFLDSIDGRLHPKYSWL
jgi:hypothetical protein